MLKMQMELQLKNNLRLLVAKSTSLKKSKSRKKEVDLKRKAICKKVRQQLTLRIHIQMPTASCSSL
jgi:hypothetical protein